MKQFDKHIHFYQYYKTEYWTGASATIWDWDKGGMYANKVDTWRFSDNLPEDDETLAVDEKAKNVYGNGHTSLYADFIDAIKNNRKPYVDLYVGKRVIEIVLAIYKSQKTGLPVKFPLKDFASIDMQGEFSK